MNNVYTPSNLVRTLVAKLDWVPFRKPPVVADYELNAAAYNWLNAVPIHSRPLLLSRKFPRIVNKLASLWEDEKGLDRYIDDLLGDHREGAREGFPEGVREEVLVLRIYLNKQRARAARLANSRS